MDKQQPETYTIHIGMNSGIGNLKKNSNLILIDLDNHIPTQSQLTHAASILNINFIELWESSPNHYWITIFKSTRLARYIWVCKLLGADPKFINCIRKNGYGTLRLTSKKGFIPKLISIFTFSMSKPYPNQPLLNQFKQFIDSNIQPGELQWQPSQ